jgi:hypothetical protein
VGGILQLAQLGAVAVNAEGRLREENARQGGQQPQVVGLDEVRVKASGGSRQRGRESLQVAFEHVRSEAGEPGGNVGHDVAHAGYGKRDRRPVEAHGNDVGRRQRRDVRQRLLPGQTDHGALPPPRLRPEADKGEQRNPAAGFPRLLGQQMQNVQSFFPADRRR